MTRGQNDTTQGHLTDQQVTRQMLVEREQYLRTILQTTADGFWVVDTDGKIVEVNDAYGRMSGYSRAELMQLGISDLDADEAPDETAARIQRIIANGAEVFEARHRRKDGGIFDVEMSVTYLDTNGGQFVCFCRDISQRRTIEKALRESENKYLRIAENSADVVWTMDLNFRTTYVSSSIERLLGETVDAHLKKTIEERLTPDSLQRAFAIFKEEMENEKNPDIDKGRTRFVEVEYYKADGSTIWASINVSFLRDDDGNVTGIQGVTRDITDRKRTQEAFRRIEAKQAKMVANIGDVIVIIDQVGIIRYKSPNIEKYFGWRPEEVVGTSAWANVHPDDMAATQEFFLSLVSAPNATGRTQCRYRCKDGSYKWIEFTGVNLLHDPDIQGVLGNYQDITERMRAEEQLQASHDLLSNLARLVPGVIYQYRLYPDGRSAFPYASPGMNDIYEMTPEQVREDASPVFGRLHPDDYDRVAEAIQQSARNLQTFYCEFRVVLPRQGMRWRWSQAHPERMPDGSTLWHGIISDITERKRAEEALAHSHDLMRYIIEHNRSAVAVHDKELNYIYVSKRYLQDYGVNEQDVIGKNHYDIFPDLPQKWRDVHQRALAGEIISAEDDPYERENGSVEWTRWECRPWYQADGAIGGIIVYTEVITERKKLEMQLVQAQKMESVGRLAGGVAHDYNNMLSVIMGYTEMALDKVQPDDPLHADLMEIFKAARRSADITHQLLAFARKQTIDPKVVDLNELVEGMLRMLRRLIGEDIELAWHPGKQLWPLKMDPSQVNQILANLCVNARDAIAGVGKVTIGTGNIVFDEAYCETHPDSSPGGYVSLAVSDDGRGMDKTILNHIFEPFFTTKGVTEGTGLGLATVYGIVKQNNGFITVESKPGNGTTFRIYLPRYAGAEQQSKPESKTQAPMSRGETVLLVEDEPAIMKMGETMLRRLGYRVLAAGAPRQAMQLAREQASGIDLLITDVVMPEMNGRELADQLQALHPRIKTLFMSGHTADVIAHRGVLEEGMNFIQKPFSVNDLGARVRRVLDRGGSR